MANNDKDHKYLSLKSMFDSNNIKKMKDIEKLYPTMVATDLRMNHGRYITKLHNPEDFTIKQILDLALLIDVNPITITNIIIAEVSQKMNKRTKK
jgi:hypothetical protein